MRPAFWLALLGSVLVTAGASAQERPNVVVFLADDLGWGDLGAYGQERIRTPRIDALATQGMRFAQAYAGAPVCAPSRCVLWTGLHGGHCPIAANLTPNATLRPDEITIARLLGGAGYRTGIVGKWGLGGELPDGTPHQTFAAPWRMGFDDAWVVLDQVAAHDPWPDWLWRDGTREIIGPNAGGAHGAYAHDLFAEEAIAFLEEAAREPERPFFLFVGYTLPHREVHLPPEGDLYAREDWPEIERAFASMVSRLDADVGRVVDRLDALGLAGRTLVIVASDNGPQQTDGHVASFFDSNGPLRGSKRDLYEGGIRVPLIARWPGTVPVGTVEHPVGFVDVLPTLADLAGIGVPIGIDGTSLAPLLRGDAGPLDRPLVWACSEPGSGPDEVPTRFATRDGSLKLVERIDGACELFDLAADPGETTDLAAARPEDVAALRARREAEFTGPLPLVDPVLAISGPGVIDDRTAIDPGFAPVLHLRGDGDALAAAGAPVVAATSAIDRPALEAAPANGPRYDDAVAAGLVPRDGATNALSIRLDRRLRQYLAVPAHPAVAFGRASVTVEAWVRLASLGGRQWLLFAKPLGRDDAFADLGILVQSEALEEVARMHGEAHGIAVVLGDPELERPWAIASSLAIRDLDWHRVVVRIDVDRGRALIELDGRREELAFVDRGHVVSSGPLMIGAHHDASGEIDETFDGWIDELRISRGLVPDDELLSAAPTHAPPPLGATIDLGDLPLGSAPITRTITIENATTRPSRLIEGAVDRSGIDDPRLAIDAPPFGGLASGAGRGAITITFTPSSPGELAGQILVVDGTVVPYGHAARRAPLRVHVEGRVIARIPMDAGTADASAEAEAAADAAGSCAVGGRGAPGLAGLALAMLVIGRTRSGSRRARGRSRASRRCAPTRGSRGSGSARTGTSRRGSRAASRARA